MSNLKLEVGEHYTTRDNGKATIYFETKRDLFVGIIMYENDIKYNCVWNPDGSCHESTTLTEGYDIIPDYKEPEECKGELILEAGKTYITRSGHKATMLRVDLRGLYPCLGIIHDDTEDMPQTWLSNGRYSSVVNLDSSHDLISEWKEPLDFKWSYLPNWANDCIAMDRNEKWYSYQGFPSLGFKGFTKENNLMAIPKRHEPTNYSGKWHDSLIKNPNK